MSSWVTVCCSQVIGKTRGIFTWRLEPVWSTEDQEPEQGVGWAPNLNQSLNVGENTPSPTFTVARQLSDTKRSNFRFRNSFMITGFFSLITDRADWMAAGRASAGAWRAPCTCNIQNRVVIHHSTASSRQAKMQSRRKTVPPCKCRIRRVAVGQGPVRSTASNRTESNCKCDLTPFTV